MSRRLFLVLAFAVLASAQVGCGEESCTPSCDGFECGDDGCGGSCGSCPGAAPICNDSRMCVKSCSPTCSGKVCGGDGCGGSCGTCSGNASVCNDFGKCVAECIPDCSTRECGSDGCGGTCGTCPGAAPICTDAGHCKAECVPNCSGKDCGDNGCGGSCGTCTNGTCVGGVCGCNDSYDCNATSICYQDNCVTAYGRQYRITFVSASISEYGPDGSTWDGFGGAPDPFVYYKFDSTTGSTAAKADTYSPEWNKSVDVQLSQSQTIVITVYDEDASSDDIIAEFELSQIPISVIKDGGVVYTWANDYLAEFIMAIEPK